MIGNRGAPPSASRIDAAVGSASRAEHSRGDSEVSSDGLGPGLVEERGTRSDRHACGLRLRRQGDRKSADGDLRRVRIVRHVGAGRVHGTDAQPARGLPGAGLCGRSGHRPGNVLLAKCVARCRSDGRRRVRDSLLRCDQRLLRRRRHLRIAHVHPAGDDHRVLLPDAGTPRGLGTGGGGGNLRAHAAVATTPTGHAAQ